MGNRTVTTSGKSLNLKDTIVVYLMHRIIAPLFQFNMNDMIKGIIPFSIHHTVNSSSVRNFVLKGYDCFFRYSF